ncbi:hypothetical protein KR75_23940 [Klebsiella variicola]|nr:hypothetical protein KR75_23940 [Klebsiella variicola]
MVAEASKKCRHRGQIKHRLIIKQRPERDQTIFAIDQMVITCRDGPHDHPVRTTDNIIPLCMLNHLHLHFFLLVFILVFKLRYQTISKAE